MLFRSYPTGLCRPSRGTQPCPPSRTSPPPSRWRPSRTAWTACRWGAWSTRKHHFQKQHDVVRVSRDLRGMISIKNRIICNPLKSNPTLDPDHKPFDPALNPCKKTLRSFSLYKDHHPFRIYLNLDPKLNEDNYAWTNPRAYSRTNSGAKWGLIENHLGYGMVENYQEIRF